MCPHLTSGGENSGGHKLTNFWIKKLTNRRALCAAIFTAVLAATFTWAGCNRENHPDVKYAVDSAMTQNGLGVVKVSQDREKGVLTLKR